MRSMHAALSSFVIVLPSRFNIERVFLIHCSIEHMFCQDARRLVCKQVPDGMLKIKADEQV